MNEIEATRAKLKCLKMVECTGLNWWDVVRLAGYKCKTAADFSYPTACYTFALGVVEGKPVWEDSRVFAHGIPVRIKQTFGDRYILIDGTRIDKDVLTWSPPKPATLIVELPIKDVEFWNQLGEFWIDKEHCKHDDVYMQKSLKFYSACKKALEKLK